MPYRLQSGVLVYRYGERGSGYRLKDARASVPQDYEKLRQSHFKDSELFEDPEFPANKKSLGAHFQGKPVQWKRPHEFLKSPPKFFVGGVSRFDVKQGELGNCWLLAAVANLTMNPQLFQLIVPENNAFREDHYSGIFHFRFWKFGKWVDVVVDDRLPTRNGRLVFLHSADEAEMWSALLEKAYAKIHGSYDKLIGGEIVEALEDFTGGLSETWRLDEEGPSTILQIMEKAFKSGAFLGCSIDSGTDSEEEGPLGLVKGHAYSITGLRVISFDNTPKTAKSILKTTKAPDVPPAKKKRLTLLRIRNPWGDGTEWQGAWSDGSKEWDEVPPSVLKEFDLTFSADGEFWMCFRDFLTHFQQLELCNFAPDVMEELEEIQSATMRAKSVPPQKRKRWVMTAYEGCWVKGLSAGGCRNYVATYGLNPQFLVTLVDPDEDDDDDKCTLIVALMQKNRRKLGKNYLNIGYLIYHVPDPETTPRPLNEQFFRKNRSVAGLLNGYTDSREVSCRFRLPPGTYCIVPSTFEPHLDAEFILRVFTEQPFDSKENDDEVEIELERLESDGLEDAAQEATDLKAELKEARHFFKKVAGSDMEVNWEELQVLLDTTFKLELKNFQGFSKDICRSMIAMMDADRSGKLDFDEFQILWQNVKDWRTVFFRFDEDKSGTLSLSELRQALNCAGFRVNNRVLQALVVRYGNRDGSLAFDDFLSCTIKLKGMVEVFQERLADGEKTARFSLDEWLERTLYA